MERWVIYAFISMCFAGFTAVIAKQGLVGISAELGLTLRTLFVCIFIFAFASMTIAPSEVKSLQQANFIWLSLSAATTAGSWILLGIYGGPTALNQTSKTSGSKGKAIKVARWLSGCYFASPSHLW